MTETTGNEAAAPGADVVTVLIVGAGPTGLTLACELARRGVSFRLIEDVPGPQPGSRGKGIQPRTLEVFEDLGIIDRVLANGRMAMPMVSTAPDGRVTRGGAAPEELQDRPDIPYTASLINFGDTPAAGALPPGLRTLHVTGQPAGPGDIADTGGHLAKAYGANGRTLVLIRPDGYIGLISDTGDTSAVSDYLTAIG
jgi:FAD binding domain